MADARLQDLRRRVAAGDVAARPELLVARVRVGELAQGRLELAARVGDRDARKVLGWPVCDPINPLTGYPHGLATWLRYELEPSGPEALVRAGIAAAREVLRHGPVERWARHSITCALGAAQGWADDQTTERARKAELLGPGTCGPRLRWCTSIGQAIAAYDQASRTHALHTGLVDVGHEFACEAITTAAAVLGEELNIEEAGEAHVREAIREALVPWALGEAP